MDDDSPFADYRESWIGGWRNGDEVPMGRDLDRELRGRGTYPNAVQARACRRGTTATAVVRSNPAGGICAEAPPALGLNVLAMAPSDMLEAPDTSSMLEPSPETTETGALAYDDAVVGLDDGEDDLGNDHDRGE